jgi:serine protease inhibitor
MNSDRNVPYYAGDAFSMISLPFKSGENEGKYAMAFLLPSEGTSVADMLSSLDASSFSAALSGMAEQHQKVDQAIRIHKFNIAHRHDVSHPVAQLRLAKELFESLNGDRARKRDVVVHPCYPPNLHSLSRV